MPIEIITVQNKDKQKARLDFAAELAAILISNEYCGQSYLDDLQDESDQITFLTGYTAGIYDWLTARLEGRLIEPGPETQDGM